MNTVGRRTFLGTSLGLASLALTRRLSAWDTQTVRLAVIGCGGRGTGVGREFSQLPGVEILYACDPDKNRLDKAQSIVNAKNAVTDMRHVFDDKAVDAVIIATPDHWHTPAAILACDAGKHVYVEKPCSHSLEEGRLLVEAARRNDRHVQHGTQRRSYQGIRDILDELKEGLIGEVLVAKAINSQKRADIGHASPSEPPAYLDYDLWVGPAPMQPYQENLIPYNWHWFYNFGTGDIGNDGVHQLDVARWGLGVKGLPSKVTGYGAKLFFDDDQQFPDTYLINFEYPKVGKAGMPRTLIFEQRIWTDYETEECTNGNVFYGTEAKLVINHDVARVIGKGGKVIREEKGPADQRSHFENFLAAVRGDAKLNAEIIEGHLSASLCHLGNIVAKSGQSIAVDRKKESIRQPKKLANATSREYREGHWAAPKTA